MRANKEISLSYQQHNQPLPSSQKIDFHLYLEKFSKTKNYDNQNNFRLAGVKLKEYSPVLKFNQIDRDFCEGFKRYLLDHLGTNSAYVYYSKIIATLNQAVRERIIVYNPSKNIDPIKKKDKPREYLTLEELRVLASTNCESPDTKRLFLFGCLTGLRKVDLMKLHWRDIKKDQGWHIVFDQSKKGGLNYLPLSDQALQILGPFQKGKVFKTVPALWWHLREWVKDAKINKKISFHSSRHTFATLMLNHATDNVRIVQDLLGHKSVRTTEVYAKIVHKSAKEAIGKIPEIL